MGTPMFGTLASSVLVLFVRSAPQVPPQPDFSGEWVLVKASGSSAEQASALTVRQTITSKTMRGEPMTPWFSEMAVQRRFKDGAVSETNHIGIIGGTVSQSEWMTTSVTWRGNSLVIETERSSHPPGESGPYTAREEVWSLDRNGRLLITVTDRGSNIKPTTVRLVYRRRQARNELVD